MGVVTVRDLQGRTPPVTAPVQGNFLAFGPDGRLAIALSDPEPRSSPIVLWRPGDAGGLRQLAPPDPPAPADVSQVAYSSDGRWVAAAGTDSPVRLWDTTRDESPRSLPYTGLARDLAFGPDGRLVLAADDGTIRIWDVDETAPPVLIRQPGEFTPRSVAVSSDGDRIAVGGFDKVVVWSDGGRTGPEIYRGPEYWYTSVAFSPDGRRLAAGTNERTIRIWTVPDSNRGLALRGHYGAVRELAFSPDGRRLVSGSDDDSTVRVWDTTGAADPATVALPDSGKPARLSDDGSFAATPTGPGTISVLPIRTPQNATTLHNIPTDLDFLAVGGGGRGVVATTLDSEQIHWWRSAADDKPAVLDCQRRLPWVTSNSAVLSEDGRVLAVDCGDNNIRVWRAGDRWAGDQIGGYGPIAVNPAANLVAMFRNSHELVLWDPAASGPVRTLKGQSGLPEHVRFSPDGRLLATAGQDGAIRVWTVATDDDPVVLTGTVGQIKAISFSPDGKRIAGAGTDDVVRLWNTDGSGEALTFDHPGNVRQLAFSADGRQFITLYGTTVRLTPCEVCGPIDEVLALARQRTTRDFTPEERAKYLRQPG